MCLVSAVLCEVKRNQNENRKNIEGSKKKQKRDLDLLEPAAGHQAEATFEVGTMTSSQMYAKILRSVDVDPA